MPEKPVIKRVVLNAVNVTELIKPDILSLTYTDLLEAGASTFDLELRNRNRSMATPPKMGDYMEIRFGYQNSTEEVNTGTHRIDDVVREYGHDTSRVGARAYDYGIGLKTTGAIVYTNQTLRAIIQDVATRFGLTLVGTSTISTEIVGTTPTPGATNAVTVRNDQSWLSFVQELAVKYGYFFNLKFGELVFRSIRSLNAVPTVGFITGTDAVPRPRFRENIQGNYKTAIALIKNNTQMTVVDDTSPGVTDTVDLSNEGFYNNSNSAFLRGLGAVLESNKDRHVGSVKVPGRTTLIAGNNFDVAGLDDRDNGIYAIDRAVHTVSPTEGWTTQLDLRRIFFQEVIEIIN